MPPLPHSGEFSICREKCHCHRRIRQGRIRKRQIASRCRARRRALALETDPDDFFSLRLRASAIVVRHRFRRSGSSNPWLNRHRRNDRRISNRDLPDSGNVLRSRKVCGPKEVCGQAAIATSRVSSAARNSGTRIGFGCFSVAFRSRRAGFLLSATSFGSGLFAGTRAAGDVAIRC